MCSSQIVPSNNKLIALRLDDVGACSKKFEIYSNKFWNLGKFRISANWLFLKYLPKYKAWGPYRELTKTEWLDMLTLLKDNGVKLTVAVTAAWAEEENNLIPFPTRFPEVASILRDGVNSNLLEIANHGLTHCVLKDNVFKPKLLSGNREFHREFISSVPQEVQNEHLKRSQDILESWFGVDIVTFVPPGNSFTEETLLLAKQHGIHYVSCNTKPIFSSDPMILGNQHTIAFHDRDIVLNKVDWLQTLIQNNKRGQFCFIKELVDGLKNGNK